jgi:hypothetical protein
MTTTRFFNFQPKIGNNTPVICLPIPSTVEPCHLPSSPTAYCSHPSSFARKSCARSSSSNATSPGSFFLQALPPLRCLVGECSPCVGEYASFSPMWCSRASDWPLRLPICTWPSCRGVELSPFLYVQSKHQEFTRKAWRSL